MGRKVRLRRYRPGDAAARQPFYDDSEMERTGSDVHFPRDAVRARRGIEREIAAGTAPAGAVWLIIETLAESRPIGNVGLNHMNPRRRAAEIGITLWDRAAWGQGYASEAMRLLLRFAFRELDYAKINLTVLAANARAIALYEHLGFRHEGRRCSQVYGEGGRTDEILMGLTREEYDAQHPIWFPDAGMSTQERSAE